jgi:hypothetical protein
MDYVQIDRIESLAPGDGFFVAVESIVGLDMKKYAVNEVTLIKNGEELKMNAVVAKPNSFMRYATNVIKEFINDGAVENDITYVYSMFKPDSEKTTLYRVAANLNIVVSLSLNQNVWTITKKTELDRINYGELLSGISRIGDSKEIDYSRGTVSKFQAAILRHAEKKGLKVSLKRRETNKTITVTVVEGKGLSKMAQVHEWLSTLTEGVAYEPPKDMCYKWRSTYFRTLISKFHRPVSFKGGLVTVGTKPSAVDSTGDFILNGVNLGPRSTVYINLRLKPFGLTIEDIK